MSLDNFPCRRHVPACALRSRTPQHPEMTQTLTRHVFNTAQEFVPVARELEGNWTRFTPHYIVWVCPESYRASDECQSQCIHNGRYCTPDPDGDLLAGYSGKDIVQVWPSFHSEIY